MTQPTDANTLLEVKNLQMHYPITAGLFARNTGAVKAVDDVSFTIARGETLGLVGESGCGKTSMARSIVQLYKPTSGEVLFDGEDLVKLKGGKMRAMYRRVQFIFQDPYGSLDPRMTCGDIIGEPLKVHKLTNGKDAYRARIAELLTLVGLNPYMANRFPHEFSGGQRQRIGIARALAVEPELLICDEPVSALDVSVQAQIINLLEELQEKFGLTYLFIAHDLSLVRHISHRVAVMYLGRLVEVAESDELFSNPQHPYTKALMSAIPLPDPIEEINRERIVLQGEPPSPAKPPPGCVFNPRCPIAIEDCKAAIPELREISPGHFVACIRV
ncbi:MAG: ATP-binding cassette domain-containing protein [SAR202 cluster bacterium]|nr:ATP-binding cassette domain-containing protein [SAR202 cluster bacterium]|tara:strand:+ start:1832 stop:2821 length:990 start_codon:yes stop_codon:yes gene_type:complete